MRTCTTRKYADDEKDNGNWPCVEGHIGILSDRRLSVAARFQAADGRTKILVGPPVIINRCLMQGSETADRDRSGRMKCINAVAPV